MLLQQALFSATRTPHIPTIRSALQNAVLTRRKSILFGVNLVRGVWARFSERQQETVVEIEQAADLGKILDSSKFDGSTKEGEGFDQHCLVSHLFALASDYDSCCGTYDMPGLLASLSQLAAVIEADYRQGEATEEESRRHRLARKRHAETLLDMFRDTEIAAPPFSLLDKAGSVYTLAKEIYEKRQFQKLPLLSQLLVQAGYTSSTVLQHCNQRQTHVRGCWVVDMLLGF